MRWAFIFSIAILLTQCGPDKDVLTYSANGRVVVDSATQGEEFLPFDHFNNNAYYPVYYIGQQQDTFCLGRRPISMASSEELDNKYNSATNWSTRDFSIDVFVDTTMNVGYEIIYSHLAEDGEMEIVDSTKSIKAFAMFITNTSDSLVMLGTHNFVRCVTREVLDQDGNWIEVERRLTDLSVTAKRRLVLEPGDILIGKVLRYSGGDTKFPCRLKLSVKFGDLEAYRTYSNIFEDYVDMELR